MYKQKLCLLVCTLGFFIAFKTNAQIVASQTIGCAPLSVLLSGPPGATNVLWNLGGSLGTSTLSNPNPIYNSPGTYNVTYTAIVNSSPVSYQVQIIVNAGPSASFSYVIPNSHCAPMTASFAASGGPPNAVYSWAFGDLTSIVTGSALPHTYGFSGNFIPVVTVLDPVTGCTAVATAASGGTISVSNAPNPIISSSNGFTGCQPPFVSVFTGTNSISGSPIPGPISSYAWSFGGGSPGSSASGSPGSVSFSAGQNVVSLTVTDNNQCSMTQTALVVVGNPSLTVNYSHTTCLNGPFNATVNSSQPFVSWSFNAANPTSTNTPVIPNVSFALDTITKFNTPGIQSFTVSVSAGPACTPVVQTYTVFVEQVNASFIRNPNNPHTTCGHSLAVNYINTSTVNSGSPLTFTWSVTFPGNASNTVIPSTTVTTNQSPNATFTMSQGSKNPYTIYNFHIHNIYLYAQTPSGCKDTVWHTDMDTVVRASAFFNKSAMQGCAPLSVVFRDTSFTYSSIYPITGYTWCNGAAPPVNVSVSPTVPITYSPIPSHTFTYPNQGIYYPYLIIQTAHGCVDTSFIDTVIVTTPPNINAISFSPSPSACADKPVQMFMSGSTTGTTSSTNTFVINHWHVTTDSGYFSGCITNPIPIFPFTHVGVNTFTVTAYDHGCGTSSVMTQSITIKGPLGRFQFQTNCDGNKKQVNFFTRIESSSSAILYYGDGTQQNYTGNISGTSTFTSSHTYSLTGDYTARLISFNNTTGCSPDTFKLTVKIRQPRARITYGGQQFPPLPNAIACTKSRYLFEGSTSTDALMTCGRGYVWYLSTPTYTLHPFELDANYPQACGVGCAADEIALDTFRVAGIYTITLRIKDENGCQDTTTRVFRISSAEPAFTLNPNPLCLSDSVLHVQNGTQANQVSPDAIVGYTLNYGDPFPIPTPPTPPSYFTYTNPLINPTHTYSYANSPNQTFSVMMIAQNSIGCKDTLIKTFQINNPNSNFSTSNAFPCIKLGQATNVSFSATPGFVSYSLNIGDPPGNPLWNNTPSFNNVTHNYNTPGTYVATLIATDNQGCKSVQTKTVTAIGQPTANMVFKDNINRFCVPGNPTVISTSAINVSTITTYYWSMGGPVSPGNATVTNILPTTGIYTVTLFVNVNGYCQSTDTALVFVSDPKASLTLDKNRICLGDVIKVSVTDSSSVFGWQWFFGDNQTQPSIVAGTPLALQTQTLAYPYNTFPTGSSYGQTQLTLLYYAAGRTCLRTSTANLLVVKVEPDFIRKDSLYMHCVGVPDDFFDKTQNPHSLGYQYNWNFGGVGNSGQQNPSFLFQNPGQYPVTLEITTSDPACKGVAVKNITVFPLPTSYISAPDTVCPATPFIITGGGSPGLTGNVTASVSPATSPGTFVVTPPSSFSMQTSADASTTYSLSVVDNNGCKSGISQTSVYVPQALNPLHWDTTVIIGETVTLNGNSGTHYTYTWSPETRYINCINCTNPASTSTIDITYTLQIEDSPLACFKTINTYSIHIDPRTSIDVPTAFTPNSDGTNDFIFPNGWGVKKMNYFKVYNRWGQLLFETNEFRHGWDGRFNGVPQNMETYIYQVSVETYTKETLTKAGTFKLIR